MKKELSANTSLSHYRIVAPLGAGGMGEVYLAEDTRLKRKVALKLLPVELTTDAERVRRFEQEAQAASALNHPHIITVYDIGECEAGRFIVMELVAGRTLRAVIAEDNSLETLLTLGQQMAKALSAAHAAGITHRDIKPDNIMVREDGYLKVLDFGLARLRPATESNSEAATLAQQTTPGTVMGTVAYMSPEQARGETVSSPSDVFALGIVLYELATGRHPFKAETLVGYLHAITLQEPPPLTTWRPELPAALNALILRMLSKDASQRSTASEVARVLQDIERRAGMIELPSGEGDLDPSANADAHTLLLKPTTATEPADLATAGGNAQPTSPNQPQTRKVLAAALLGLVLLVGGYYGYRNLTSTKQIESIAVMPFVNASGNADAEYLSDGMTETLISSLSQLPNLNVKARSSVFRYKGKEIDLPKIAQELKVQAILTGRVVQRGEQLTLSLELVDTQTENAIWSEQYNRKQADLVTLQTEIARDVSGKLKTKLSGAEQAKLTKTYTTDPQAYRLYLQGRFYWNKRAGKEFDKAESYFRQAVEKDPNFALGYVGLADANEDQDRPRRKEYIRRALLLDDQLAEAHASLGYQYMLDYNWTESERELKRALELNPNYAQAHGWNGARLMMLGRYDESQAAIKRALELDSTATGINFYRCVLLYVSGKTDESLQQFKQLAEMEPTFSWAHRWLSRIYRQIGNRAASVEERAKGLEIDGKPEDARRTREIFATGGWHSYLKDFIQQNPPSSGSLRASVLAELGAKEETIDALTKTAAKGDFWLFLIKTDPFMNPLRGDPRFQELLKKFDPPQ